MAETMIRKQVYLERRHDRKLKAIARRRGCTEAEVIREAIERLPDEDGDLVAQLEGDGLLAHLPDDPSLPRGAALRQLDQELETWLAAHPEEDLRLSEAVLQDRQDRL
jgi:hypothetical protein